MRRNWGGNKQLLKKTNHLRIFEFGPVHNCANLVDREHRFISERPISRYDRRRARRDMASEICRDATPPKVITYALFTCVTGGPIVAAIGVDWILSSRDIGGRSFVRHSLYIPTEKEGPDCGYVFHSEQARTITIPTSSWLWNCHYELLELFYPFKRLRATEKCLLKLKFLFNFIQSCAYKTVRRATGTHDRTLHVQILPKRNTLRKLLIQNSFKCFRKMSQRKWKTVVGLTISSTSLENVLRKMRRK